jgi:hypothetical protein
LISALFGDGWPASHSGRFISGGGVPDTHWIENWMCTKTDLDDIEKKTFYPIRTLLQAVSYISHKEETIKCIHSFISKN